MGKSKPTTSPTRSASRAGPREAPAPPSRRVKKSSSSPSRHRAADPAPAPARRPDSFPIVGVGASAGGLEAYAQLLRALPPRTGMAFVLVQHLDPTHESLLHELLGRETEMDVVEAHDGMPVAPDRVHVIPPNTALTIESGLLWLRARAEDGGLHLPIDRFFESLAADRRTEAIGVVLSGSGSDGTQGLKAIKAAGGLTFAQEPTSAKWDAMPRSAIAEGAADHVLPPQEIASQLVQLARHAYVRPTVPALRRPASLPREAFEPIVHRLREATGVDFRGYKPSTVQRRIARRLAVHQMADLGAYARYLTEHPEEVLALYEDLLIHVTGFFRDPDAFEALSRTVLPAIVKRTRPGDSIRIWVPGCSTGEEAYSLAICMLEVLARTHREVPVKIFASDLSEVALRRARAGAYPDAIRQDVLQKRLERFFVRSNGGYRVSQRVRDLCVFLKHDLFRDPPLSRLDLISCRNVLIYLGPDLHAKAIPIFHYALNPQGHLLLGRSESLSRFAQFFRLVDKPNRIYARKPGRTLPRLGAATRPLSEPGRGRPEAVAARGAFDLQRATDEVLLSRYVPPGVVVNADMEILLFRGHTGPYLESPPGKAELNLMKMAREGLVSELRVALHRAKQTDEPVRREAVQVRTNGEVRDLAIEVVPIKPSGTTAKERYFLVLFDERALAQAGPPPAAGRRGAAASPADPRHAPERREVVRLREELASTKAYLLSLVEEYEATNEELSAANEEVLSTNEELQSTNEELETAKEELQSTNEELNTVNDELRHRNQDLSQLNSDLTNLLGSVNLGIVLLGGDRRIRQFTPQAERLLNLIPSDVGRPIGDLRHNLDVPDLGALIGEVEETGTVKEQEVLDRAGRHHRMQVRPYRTVDNRVDGCVLVLVDITELKRAEAVLRFLAEASERLASSLDSETTLASVARLAVPDFAEWCAVELLQADGSFRRVATVYADPDQAALAQELERQYPQLPNAVHDVSKVVRTGDSEIVAEVPDSVPATLARDPEHLRLLRAVSPRSYICASLVARGHSLGAITFASMTPRRYGPADLALAEDVARRAALAVDNARLYHAVQEAVRARDDFLGRAAHEFRTPLTVVNAHLALLAKGHLAPGDAEAVSLLSTAVRQVERMIQLILDLLDSSRITADRLRLESEPLDLAALVAEAVAQVQPLAQNKGVALVNALEGSAVLDGDRVKLEQVMVNLLTNAVKFTPAGGAVRVSGEVTGASVELRVRDTGAGLPREYLERVFEPFFQVETATGRRKAAGLGTGLGLAIVRRLVELHGGRVWAESEGPGRGSTFVVSLPGVKASPESEESGRDRTSADGLPRVQASSAA